MILTGSPDQQDQEKARNYQAGLTPVELSRRRQEFNGASRIYKLDTAFTIFTISTAFTIYILYIPLSRQQRIFELWLRTRDYGPAATEKLKVR